MPYEHPARAARRRTTGDPLARAIADIDRRLEQHRTANEPAPFSAYRARRILKKAQAGKLHDAGILIAACANEQAAQPDAVTSRSGIAGARLSDARRSRALTNLNQEG